MTLNKKHGFEFFYEKLFIQKKVKPLALSLCKFWDIDQVISKRQIDLWTKIAC